MGYLYGFVRSNLVLVTSVVLAACWFAPVLSSHFADADSYYAHVSVIPQYDHISAVQAYARTAATYNHAAGGWFPLRALPLVVWQVDSHFRAAKYLQFLVIVATLLVFGLLATRMFRGSSNAAVIAVAGCLACWQFRTPHDPVVGTSLFTTWEALLFFLACYTYVRFVDAGRNVWLLAAVAILEAAMLAGAIAWVLAIALAVGAFWFRLRGAAWLGGAALLASMAIVGLDAPALPWAHGGVYALNVLNQLLSPIPLTYRAFGHLAIGHVPNLYHGVRYIDDRFINIPPPSRLAWLAVLLTTGASFYAVIRLRKNEQAASAVFPWAGGLALWIVPAVLLGPRVIWPHGLPVGQSFDGVYFQYFGIGLLLAAALQRWGTKSAAAPVTAAIVSLAVFVSCYGNVRANGWVLARTAAADYNRSVIERAGSAGFFDKLAEGTTLAVSPTFTAPSIAYTDVSSLKYLFFHYSHRKFNVVSASRLSAADVGRDWIVATHRSRDAGLLLTASHLGALSASSPLTDRSYGFTPFSYVVDEAAAPRSGVRLVADNLKDGWVIFAERTCGDVPLTQAFAESRPVLEYGAGFYHSGPVGYAPPAVQTDALGDVSTDPNMYPKMFMSSQGELYLHKTSCSDDFLNLQAVAVSASPAMLRIHAPGRVDKIRITPTGAHFWLRFNLHKAHSPLAIRFNTNAPPAPKFDPIIFHYEHDRPRGIRIIFEPEGLWEDRGNPNERG